LKLAQVNGTALIKAFVALPGGAKAIYNTSGLAYFRHSDWLGSSRLTSTATRTMYSSTAYAPFGEQYGTTGTGDPSFTGQDQDTVTSLYDFPARRQSPSQGRWISPDPAGRAAVTLANPQSWNRYGYVNNNPLALTDAMGLSVRHRHHAHRRMILPARSRRIRSRAMTTTMMMMMTVVAARQQCARVLLSQQPPTTWTRRIQPSLAIQWRQMHLRVPG
jgi:RHS repeat-associated protein